MEKSMTEAQAISLTKFHNLLLKQMDDTCDLLFNEMKIKPPVSDIMMEKLELIALPYSQAIIAFGQINDIDQVLISGYFRSIIENLKKSLKERLSTQ